MLWCGLIALTKQPALCKASMSCVSEQNHNESHLLIPHLAAAFFF